MPFHNRSATHWAWDQQHHRPDEPRVKAMVTDGSAAHRQSPEAAEVHGNAPLDRPALALGAFRGVVTAA